MKKLILLLSLFLLSNLSFAADIDKFLGKWTIEGEVFLIISQEDDVIKLKSPENKTWKAEFQNIRIEEGVFKFEKINYSIDNSFKEKHGMEHPYSGVVNYSEIWEDDEGNMLYRVWTDYAKDESPVAIQRLKE